MKQMLMGCAAALVVSSFGLAPALADPPGNASDQAAAAAKKDQQAARHERDRAAALARRAEGHAKTAISASADTQKHAMITGHAHEPGQVE